MNDLERFDDLLRRIDEVADPVATGRFGDPNVDGVSEPILDNSTRITKEIHLGGHALKFLIFESNTRYTDSEKNLYSPSIIALMTPGPALHAERGSLNGELAEIEDLFKQYRVVAPQETSE